MSDPILVKIQTTHECLSQGAPVFDNIDMAVLWLKLIYDTIKPEAWKIAAVQIDPAIEGFATMVVKACFGVGA